MNRSLVLVVAVAVGGCSGDHGNPGATPAQPNQPKATPPNAPALPPAVAGMYRDIVDTDEGACVLYTDGRVACWRSSTVSSTAAPKVVPDISDAIAIERVEHAVRILRRTGKIFERGLSFGRTDNWVAVPGEVVEIADRCVRLADGTAHCECLGVKSGWQPPPIELAATDLSAGGNARCAVTTTRDVVCWGQPNSVLGSAWIVGKSEIEGWCPSAHTVFRFGDAVQVTVGYEHACVLRSSGAVTCWGREDERGGPANGRDAQVNVKIPPARSIRTSSTGTCAITTDAHAYCWGFFGHPAFAKGIISTQREPVQLPLEHVVAVSQRVSCALVDDGNRVVCWGIRDGCQRDECFATYEISLPQ